METESAPLIKTDKLIEYFESACIEGFCRRVMLLKVFLLDFVYLSAVDEGLSESAVLILNTKTLTWWDLEILITNNY